MLNRCFAFLMLVGSLCLAQNPPPSPCSKHLAAALAAPAAALWTTEIAPIHLDLSGALPQSTIVELHRRLLSAFSTESVPPVSVRVNYLFRGEFREFSEYSGEQRTLLEESGTLLRSLLNEIVFPQLNKSGYQGYSDWSEACVVGASLRVLSSRFPLRTSPGWHTDGGVSIVTYTGIGRGTPLPDGQDVPEGHLVVLAPEVEHSIVFGTPHDRWMVQAFLSRDMHENPAYRQKLIVEDK